MANDGASEPTAARRDLGTLLREAELLLAHLTGDAAESHKVEPALVAEAVEALSAMRSAVESGGAIGVDVERRFFTARTVLSRAASPATIDSLEAYRRGEATRQYMALRVAGTIVFVVLVLAFLAFSLLNQSLGSIDTLNGEIDKLSLQAVELRENARCERLGGHNYQVNLRKEKIHLAYGAVLTASTIMALPTVPFTHWRRDLSVELYPELLVARRDEQGSVSCVEPPRPPQVLGGGSESNTLGNDNPAHARRMQCWLVGRTAPGGFPHPVNLDCGMQEVEQSGRAVLWTYANLILPMLFGTYGGLVAARRRALWRLGQRTLTADRARGYWMRIGIGAFFGAFLSQVLPSFAGDPLFAKLPPFALAFLAGYKVEGVLELLDRFLNPEHKRDKAAARPGTA